MLYSFGDSKYKHSSFIKKPLMSKRKKKIRNELVKFPDYGQPVTFTH